VPERGLSSFRPVRGKPESGMRDIARYTPMQ
jgi:hypothetical protein